MSEKKKKVFEWMKTKRHYIVLALCVATVSATYLLLQAGNKPQIKQELSAQSEPEAALPHLSAPLPDLAEYFPPELEPETKNETYASKKPKKVPEQSNAVPAPSVPTATDTASVEKQPLRYSFPVDGAVQKAFSGNTLVFSKTMQDWRVHNGIDITAPSGTDVRACADGVIEDVYTDERMGITITINHQNGMCSVYSNLSSGLLVEVGQAVRAGEVISTVGSSALFEAADESHLHFEITREGEYIDPASLLQ